VIARRRAAAGRDAPVAGLRAALADFLNSRPQPGHRAAPRLDPRIAQSAIQRAVQARHADIFQSPRRLAERPLARAPRARPGT